MSFNGPCKGPIEVQVQVHGTSQTPAVPSNFKGVDGWVTFQHIGLLTMPVKEKKNMHQSLSSMEVFDPNKYRWSFISDMSIAIVPCINSLHHDIYLIEDLAQLNLDILVEMGTYAHVQADYLACFSDHKCFWLVLKTLECSNKEPKKLLYYVATNEINWSWVWTA
nr:farnesyl pyrophosphate synthase 2 [Quercus suber]